MNIIRKAGGTELPRQTQRVFLSYKGCNVADRQLTDWVFEDLNLGIWLWINRFCLCWLKKYIFFFFLPL